MILTKCAHCAAPNAHTKCGICKTRYCGRDCQKLHWKAGHRAICQEIKRGGGAEQYHANKKYTEAVAVAVEACADDTKGQTCYICLDGDAEEGLVRMCACRGAAGFAHLSCLAKQAKVLVAGAEERDLGAKAFNERWARWHTCSLCKQAYHGVVRCALGWACWKTYLGRSEDDWNRGAAMSVLGNGLGIAGRHEESLSVKEAELSMRRRLGASEDAILFVRSNLANTYQMLGRHEEALSMRRDAYSRRLRLHGEEQEETLRAASNYAVSLADLQRFKEAKSLMRKTMPMARRVLGESHDLTLKIRKIYADALYRDDGATLDDVCEAVETLEQLEQTSRRVFGRAHPHTKQIALSNRYARDALSGGLDHSIRPAVNEYAVLEGTVVLCSTGGATLYYERVERAAAPAADAGELVVVNLMPNPIGCLPEGQFQQHPGGRMLWLPLREPVDEQLCSVYVDEHGPALLRVLAAGGTVFVHSASYGGQKNWLQTSRDFVRRLRDRAGAPAGDVATVGGEEGA